MYAFRQSTRGAASGDERLGAFAVVLQTFGALLLAAAILATPSILNRFPFIFYDSASYIARATAVTDLRMGHAAAAARRAADATDDASVAPDRQPQAPGSAAAYRAISHNPFFLRPITYSVLLVPFSISALFYLLPLAQGFFCAYVIRRLLCLLSIESWRSFFGVIVGLTALSSLPIHVSYAMPDVFTGVLVVMSFVVVYGWPTRSAPGRVLDAALMVGLIAVHLSHLPIVLALIVVYALGACFLRKDVRPMAILAGVFLPLVVAIALLIGSNVAVAHKPVISESSPLFLLARLVGDGPAVSYLREHCGAESYLLCSHLDGLAVSDGKQSVSDFFLWDSSGAVKQIADPRLVPEAAKIDSATIREFPLQVMGNVIRNGFRQLARFQVDDDINSPPVPFVVKSVREIGPNLVGPYLTSPQGRGAFPLQLARAAVSVGLLLTLVTIAWVVARRRAWISPRVWAFVVVALAGIAANALATGGLSEVHDRYGNRIIWLAPLAALVLLQLAFRRRPAP